MRYYFTQVNKVELVLCCSELIKHYLISYAIKTCNKVCTFGKSEDIVNKNI
jgi:hypothetical protein